MSTKPIKADWEQHLSLAKKLYHQVDDNGNHIHSSLTVVDSLKAIHYTVNGLSFQATRVSAMIAGMEASVPVDPIPVINARITAGELKYTKAKGIHIPKRSTK